VDAVLGACSSRSRLVVGVGAERHAVDGEEAIGAGVGVVAGGAVSVASVALAEAVVSVVVVPAVPGDQGSTTWRT
jgi:hypothetical protein